jgi:hypothetical protein
MESRVYFSFLLYIGNLMVFVVYQPDWAIVYFGPLLILSKASRILGYFYTVEIGRYIVLLNKFGYILGDFLTNSSGHLFAVSYRHSCFTTFL